MIKHVALLLILAIGRLNLSSSAKIDDLNIRLIKSVEEQSYLEVKRLLQTDASPNARNSTGKTALMLAAFNIIGSKGIVGLLLEKGANPNATDYQGRTALMNAAYSADKKDIRLLLKAGADVNAVDNGNHTALMEAEDFKVANLLLKAGANPNIVNNQGQTALTKAARFGEWLEKADSTMLCELVPYENVRKHMLSSKKKLIELLQRRTQANQELISSPSVSQALKHLNVFDKIENNIEELLEECTTAKKT